ncbi:peptidyl-tRNA hydrolase domain-containing protein 1 [Cyanidiococcus yangmingshanensis]|uniref:peptidyl-tRNA hydrolase n=1 Tax=Cyanidiococcus yangmingshanensis TaxID=2690220 RepID=A0A7J7IQL4_9RHOD|nr:peptidyl-tRNA hydrolase domain-containing protein 1 [Cyanidiococcus yangmingshanensis]
MSGGLRLRPCAWLVPWTTCWQRPRTKCINLSRGAHNSIRVKMNSDDDPLVQYIVVRRDLLHEPYNWPVGALIAQGVHAAVAAVWRFRDRNPLVQRYCEQEDGTQMRTLVLEAPNEATLQEVAQKLTQAQIEHVTWIEQPEALCTALATAPGPRSRLRTCFPKLRLFR